MEKITSAQIEAWTHGRRTGDIAVTAISTDSRAVKNGCLFIPLAGENFDGHDYIAKAIEQGAVAVLSSRARETYPIPTIYVADTRQALLDLAGGYRAQFACPVIAVTGSVGKTTTKDLIASVLSARFRTLKTEKNFNNQIGMPLSALQMDGQTEAAVFEMGMNHQGEIASMVPAGQPTIAVITNIGTCHIENLGSREGIRDAKLEITRGLAARGGKAIFCGDEQLLYDARQHFAFDTIWYGVENPACTVRAEEICVEDDAVSFTLVLPAWSRRVTLAFPGRHNVLNALAAAAVGDACGMTAEEIVRGLASARPEGRQMVYRKNGFLIYEDCYNASPEAMEATLAAFAENSSITGRRFAAFGGMLELGDYAEEGHRRAGAAAAKAVQALYLYGANAEFTRAGAIEAGMQPEQIRIFDTHEALAEALRAQARAGDGILFKGSHGMHMERALHLFLGEEV